MSDLGIFLFRMIYHPLLSIVLLGGAVVYLVFLKNRCLRLRGDHYMCTQICVALSQRLSIATKLLEQNPRRKIEENRERKIGDGK